MGAYDRSHNVFSPVVRRCGSILNRSGSSVQIRATYSYGVSPRRVFSRRPLIIRVDEELELLLAKHVFQHHFDLVSDGGRVASSTLSVRQVVTRRRLKTR